MWTEFLMKVFSVPENFEDSFKHLYPEDALESHRQLSEGGVLSGYGVLEDPLSLFFVQATIILGICRALSLCGHYLGQPKVIFEIIGGVLLGPSAIGRNSEYLHKIFPISSLKYLGIVANIGLTFYLFLVGLELDPKLLATHSKKAGGISFFGVAIPFCTGIAISRVMFDVLQGNDEEFKDVSFTSFFVFIGTAMSITAFPVLARILKEGGLIYTRAGAMTMGAAAIDDATAWCLLTLSISIANAGNLATAGYVFATVVGFASVLLFLFKPLFERFVNYVEAFHNASMNSNLFALTVMLLFMCAWTTALLGVHAIFGAFLFGLTVPRGSHLFKECNDRIEEFVLTVTLPLYFALSGLKTDITTIRTGAEGGITVLVCFCATFGKFVGAGGASYFSGMSLRESSVIAILMNTRGLVELIVLNLGIQSGILNIRTFSVMVIMCLFTTFLTSPLVNLVYPPSMRTRALDDDIQADKLSEKHSQETDLEMINLMDSSAKVSRIALVVDSLTQLQNIVGVLSYFMPYSPDSELAVTALHFIEPTLTVKDEFLPLDEEGRLLRIDEEETDVATALEYMNDPSLKPPELLPLSVFCKAMHAGINVFRIQGNPDEFPSTLRNIGRANDCNLVMFPYRVNSTYLQKFFWTTIRTSLAPIALVYQVEAAQVQALDTDSQAGRSRANSAFESIIPPVPKQLAGAINRTPSYKRADLEEGNNAHTLYTTMPTNVLPQHRRGSITHNLPKLHTSTRSVSKIVALITGHRLDLSVFALATRFAEHIAHEVIVMIPKDHGSFEAEQVEAFATFKKEVHRYHNVKIHYLETISSDVKGLFDNIVEYSSFDVLISSVIEPRSQHVNHATGVNSRGRSNSITAAFVDVFNNTKQAHQPDVLESRLQTSMPGKYANSDLKYPELGDLGQYFMHESNASYFPTLIIMHQPERAVHRGSLQTDVTNEDTQTFAQQDYHDSALESLDSTNNETNV